MATRPLRYGRHRHPLQNSYGPTKPTNQPHNPNPYENHHMMPRGTINHTPNSFQLHTVLTPETGLGQCDTVYLGGWQQENQCEQGSKVDNEVSVQNFDSLRLIHFPAHTWTTACKLHAPLLHDTCHLRTQYMHTHNTPTSSCLHPAG